MIILKYLNKNNYNQVSFKRITANVVEVKNCEERGFGFETFDTNGSKIGDFSDYTTVYREIDAHTVQYSNNGTVYVAPAPFVPREPTQDEVKQSFIDAVQEWMDATVAERGYDNVFTAISYADPREPNEKFRAEGYAALLWRSAVWTTCYAMLDDILEGKRPMPNNPEEVINELPKINW